MSQSEISKATAADARSESARSFVRTVKAATRRKYPPEERIRIVLEGFRREVTVNDLCRREGIKPHSYYAWTKEFMEAGKERLTRDTVRNATQQEIEQFKRENGELKQVICRSLAAGTPSQKKRLSRCRTAPSVSEDERWGEGGSPGQGGFIIGPHPSGTEGPGCPKEHLLSMAEATTLSGSGGPARRQHARLEPAQATGGASGPDSSQADA